jgi:hypothetical protein
MAQGNLMGAEALYHASDIHNRIDNIRHEVEFHKKLDQRDIDFVRTHGLKADLEFLKRHGIVVYGRA